MKGWACATAVFWGHQSYHSEAPALPDPSSSLSLWNEGVAVGSRTGCLYAKSALLPVAHK